MERLLEGLWNPLLGGFVLCAGLALMVGTGLLPLRRIGRLMGGWRIGTPSGPMILVATSASMTTITAAVLAVTAAGPGALVWMWIASVLGLGLHFGEAKLARHNATAGRPALPGWASLGAVAVALLAGGVWQGSQAGEVFEATLQTPAVFGAAIVAVLAFAAARSETLTAHAIRWMPLLGLTVFAALAIGVIAADPFTLRLGLGDAINEAFGLQSATAGTVGGALSVLIAHGMMRAVSAADLGVGAAAAAGTHAPGELDPDAAGASVMFVPALVIGVLSTLAGLVVIASPESAPIADSRMFPLEQPESRGLRASQQVGQTIVLPEDTTLEKGEEYAMMLRANPRGHQMAKLYDRENAVILPKWSVADSVDTVYFRARDPERARQPAWDVAIPCDRELFGGQGEAPQFVRLTPKDPDIEFKKLAAYYELAPDPYVDVGNFGFIGAVALANSPDEGLGEHLAMFEYRGEDTPFDPRLHEFFRNQYSGPFADADADAEVPPLAFAAAEDFDAPIGSRLTVELRPDPRGVDIVRMNRVGKLEAPPWRSLLEVEQVVFRHADGVSKDLRLPVAPRLDGHRIRLDVLDPEFEDLRALAREEEYTGPFAILEDVQLEVEVHSDLRLPEAAKGRRSLVPIHDDRRPRGPQERDLYDPHPDELLMAGYTGPFQPRGVGSLVRSVQREHGEHGGQLLGLAALLLAASTTLGWALLVRAPATRLLGHVGGVVIPLAVCVAPALGGLLGATLGASLGQLAYAFAVVPVVGLLVLQLANLRNSSGS